MTRILTLKENSARYSLPELNEPVTEPLRIERDGQTLGVLISVADYQKVALLIKHEPPSPWIEEQTRLIHSEIAAFERMKPELLKTHKGKYVAIVDGKLVDSSRSKATLVKRAYSKYGRRTMLIRKVAVSQPIYFMGGPQLVQR